jgi:hypothetical protein
MVHIDYWIWKMSYEICPLNIVTFVLMKYIHLKHNPNQYPIK